MEEDNELLELLFGDDYYPDEVPVVRGKLERKDLSLTEIYEIARDYKYSNDKDSVYSYLKNQKVVQQCGDGYTYRNIIENICDELEF